MSSALYHCTERALCDREEAHLPPRQSEVKRPHSARSVWPTGSPGSCTDPGDNLLGWPSLGAEPGTKCLCGGVVGRGGGYFHTYSLRGPCLLSGRVSELSSQCRECMGLDTGSQLAWVQPSQKT